jgi:PAS domain S-box-containing protein
MPDPTAADNPRILAEVLESIADPIVAFDRQWRYTYVSRRAAQALCKPAEDMLGKSMLELFPGDIDTGFIEACERAWNEGKPVSIERHSKVLGVWVENYIYPYEDGASIQWRDITDRRRAEEALKESEAVLRAFFDSPGLMRGIIKIENGAIVHVSCNARAATMFGIARESIAGKTAAEAGAPEEIARKWVDLYEQSRRTGKPVSMEYARKDADGQDRWLLATAAFLGFDGSGIPRFAYTVLDMTDRKRAEEALRQSESRLRTLGDNLPEAALYQYRVDADGQPHVDFISAGIERMTGIPAEEYMRDVASVERGIVHEDHDALRAALARSRNDLTRFEIEVRHIHQLTGQTRWTLLRSTPTRNPDGSTVWDGIELDISDRKRVESALHDAQERLRQRIEEVETVMNVAPVAIWVSTDPECKDIIGNPMANAFYEAEPGENVSATTVGSVRRFFSNGIELKPEELPMQQAAMRNTDIRDNEMEVLLPSGRKFFMLGQASPLRDGSGRVRGVVGAFLDITERKHAEEELKRAHEMMRLAHKAANAGTWCWDLRTNELSWSDECNELFGVEPGTPLTRELFYSLVHPEDRQRLLDSLQTSVLEQRGDVHEDYRVWKRDGYHWFERRGRLISDRDGKPVQVIGFSSDMTERKRLEISLRRSNEDLQRFAYVASHDLQEPLRNIGAVTGLLLRANEGRLTPESQQYAALITRGVQTMNDLIGSLLEFSRVTNDNDPPRTVELNEVLSAALENLRERIRASGALVQAGPLPTVVGNPNLLVRVFQNLVSNAIKYRVPDRTPEIMICAHDRGDEWLFSVRDNGIGFDMKYAEQIFVAFKRLYANSSEYRGTGIGLAIVKRIVEQHGGQVCVESKPGAGTTFFFTLPKSAAPPRFDR